MNEDNDDDDFVITRSLESGNASTIPSPAYVIPKTQVFHVNEFRLQFLASQRDLFSTDLTLDETSFDLNLDGVKIVSDYQVKEHEIKSKVDFSQVSMEPPKALYKVKPKASTPKKKQPPTEKPRKRANTNTTTDTEESIESLLANPFTTTSTTLPITLPTPNTSPTTNTTTTTDPTTPTTNTSPTMNAIVPTNGTSNAIVNNNNNNVLTVMAENTEISLNMNPNNSLIETDEIIDPTQQVKFLEDTVLLVSVYHSQKFMKTMEIIVRGSQRLTALRDKIYCICDHICEGQSRKSGFFFINGTFYNDKRQNENLEYSRYILDWLKDRRRDVGGYRESTMENTTFNDLSLSLGERYVYAHQGRCEHLLIFEELRMASINDPQDISNYPIIKFQLKLRRRKCKVCEIFPAKYVTLCDPYCDETPFFFCDECYRSYHYSKEGVLLYSNYQVFPYYHE